jgi:hypothetical protein
MRDDGVGGGVWEGDVGPILAISRGRRKVQDFPSVDRVGGRVKVI